MSGSGGYYKYRCKYFYTHNCPNWVWVNNATCATCLADGREADQDTTTLKALPLHYARDIIVPHVMDGTLRYTLMEIVTSGEPGAYWTLRHKIQPNQPSGNLMPLAIAGTSDTPNPVVRTAGVHRAF